MCQPCVAATQAHLSQEEAPPLAAATAPAVVAAPATLDPATATAPPEASFTPPVIGRAPGPVRRILRGIGWGLWYGQWWTLWMIISSFLPWNQPTRVDAELIFTFVIMAVVYAFFGCLAGLIIGASNATFATGAIIGVGVGITVCLLPMLLSHNFGGVINLFFYYFTGRYVGAGITGRVQRPVGT
jgi:hypothetical protein